VGCLAAGLTLNTALFTVVDGLLYRPLPFPDSTRLHVPTLHIESAGRVVPVRTLSPSGFRALDAQARTMSCAAYAPDEFDGQQASATAAGIRHPMQIVSGLFRVLDVSPFAGRTFTAEDEIASEVVPAILGYQLWVRRFAADATAIGREWTVGRRRFRVVGIMPPGVDFPRGTNFWTPVQWDPAREHFGYLTAVVRLNGDADRVTAASAEALALLETTAASDTRLRAVRFTPLRAALRPDEGMSLVVLVVGSMLVFLITWVHVSGLQFSGTAERARELYVRVACGATRARLLRQCIVEAVLLASAAVLGSLLLVHPTIDLLVRVLPDEIVSNQTIAPDWRVFAFGGALALVGVAILCVAPAASFGEFTAGSTLREMHVGASVVARRVRGALLVVQLGFSVALSYSALSLVHQFVQLSSVDLGFAPQHLTAVTFAAPLEPGDHLARYHNYMSQLVAATAGTPGIEAVAAANAQPLSPATFLVEVRDPHTNERDTIAMRWVMAGYFATIGQRVRAGREFTNEDREGLKPVAIVNRAFQRRFGGGEMLGREIEVFGLPRAVVGVAEDSLDAGPTRTAAPQVYVPAAQFAPATTLLVRSQLPVARVEQRVRHALTGITAELGEPLAESIETLVARSLALQRARSALLSLLSLVALGLTLIGVYGGVRESVLARTRELGMRMALGASPTSIALMISHEVVVLTACGVALGLVVGVSVGHVFGSVLFALPDLDPLALLANTVLFFVAVAAATASSARRAMSVNPADALRST
jgi:putative ABC transport system permease protein